MPVHLHRAIRTDALAEALGGLLATPQDDPFATELVVVPAKGVERWLSQRLSHRLGASDGRGDGVCAGVEFRNPWSLFSALRDGAAHASRETDPWAPDALVWPLLGVLDDSLDEPWAAPLAQHLGHGETGEEADLRRGRRYAVAHRLARHLASYAVQRPALLADWLTGHDTDGVGGALDTDLAWQPELFRRLVDRVDGPPPHRRHAEMVARLREQPASLDLPGRLSLFGHTRIAETEAELLAALAEHRDVHLWLPHPSDALWRDLGAPAAAGPGLRHQDDTHRLVGHPLLATLGRDVRELQRTLAGIVDTDEHHPTTDDRPDTLLGWLQTDLAGNTVGDTADRVPAPEDRSVQVHGCHGPARQVEVLREVLLGLLADDPTLEPRDILVMCPDIEAYAPLITATFGLGEVLDDPHPAHRLRVRLADRAPGRVNPLLAVAARLIDLAGGRATATEVVDLAQSPVVRRRFGFTDDDLETLAAWVRDSGVRWGYDAEHRAPYGLAMPHNTWRFGLDRILTGVAAAPRPGGALDTALPLDDVDSNRVELAGRLAELVDRLQATTDRLTGVRPLREWVTALVEGVERLAEPDRDEVWQSGHLQRALTDVLADAGDRASTELRLPDVRAMLRGHLEGRPGRANFRTGTLTVCTMVPMRSVPHRVVCLLGVDDGVFPRHPVPDGDDVLARAPRTGERDRRSEDRQLLLDAILAARETLVVTYTGRGERDGLERAPAVPIGEVLDALDLTADAPVRDRVRVQHPLQSFDARNLQPGRLGTPEPFSFDAAAVPAAGALTADRPPRPGFVERPLSLPPADEVALDDLLGFFRHPVKGFFRALDVALPWEVPRLEDAIAVDPDGLQRWGVGDRMLHDMLAETHPNDALGLEWRRGVLPPGRLGWRIGQQIRDEAKELALVAFAHREATRRIVDVDVELPDGRRLVGTVPDVYGDRLVDVGYSKLDAKPVLAAWIRLLALSAGDPDSNYTAVAIGRAQRGVNTGNQLLGPVDHRAPQLLADLVAIYDEGRRSPVPIPLKTSFAWILASRTRDNPRWAAGKKWKSGRYPGEDAEDAHVRIWGHHAPLESLVGLGEYAERLWRPLLEHERGHL